MTPIDETMYLILPSPSWIDEHETELSRYVGPRHYLFTDWWSAQSTPLAQNYDAFASTT